jgi:hypothetical protein
MAQRNWHMNTIENGLTLSRHRSARFDFSSVILIAGGADLRKSRIAHQVRQDLWRALQHLRGYAPVVQVRALGDDLEITAGGEVQGRFPKANCEDLVAQVLGCKVRQARWARFSVRKKADAA